MNYYTPIALVKAGVNVSDYRGFLQNEGYAFNSVYRLEDGQNKHYLMIEVPEGKMEDFIRLWEIALGMGINSIIYLDCNRFGYTLDEEGDMILGKLRTVPKKENGTFIVRHGAREVYYGF